MQQCQFSYSYCILSGYSQYTNSILSADVISMPFVWRLHDKVGIVYSINSWSDVVYDAVCCMVQCVCAMGYA